MPTARTRANRKYNEKAYDRVSLMLPKGCKQAVEAYASDHGESVNGLVNRLLRQEMGIPEDQWRKAETGSSEP